MVVIPAGRFRMGCVSFRDCRDNELPVREVAIRSFELSKYEVTFTEYDRFSAATDRERPHDRGWGRRWRPVIEVSWKDAVACTQWLSSEMGKSYRLPSEAEWEYAACLSEGRRQARAGSVTKYSWGNEIGRTPGQLRGVRQSVGQ
jgi:formylglycine-generating enzyme required for sulfatase activity